MARVELEEYEEQGQGGEEGWFVGESSSSSSSSARLRYPPYPSGGGGGGEQEEPIPSRIRPIARPMSHVDRLQQLLGRGRSNGQSTVRIEEKEGEEEGEEQEGRGASDPIPPPPGMIRNNESPEEEVWDHFNLQSKDKTRYQPEWLEAAEEEELRQATRRIRSLSSAAAAASTPSRKRKRPQEIERASEGSVLRHPWESADGDDVSSMGDAEEEDRDPQDNSASEEEENDSDPEERDRSSADPFLTLVRTRTRRDRHRRVQANTTLPSFVGLFHRETAPAELPDSEQNHALLPEREFYWMMKDKTWCFFCWYSQQVDTKKRTNAYKALIHVLMQCYGWGDDKLLCQQIQYKYNREIRPKLPPRKVDSLTGRPKPPHYLWQVTILTHFEKHEKLNIAMDKKKRYIKTKLLAEQLEESWFYIKKNGQRIVSNSKDINLWFKTQQLLMQQGKELEQMTSES